MFTKSIENISNQKAREYLTFTLGEEQYGLDVQQVQEIRGFEAVTQIANAPQFILGVINLRGKIVPIIDLRIKLNLNQVLYNELTTVIILNVGALTVGAVVDNVSDVVIVPEYQIKDFPSVAISVDTQYILGIATIAECMLILLDIEQLLSGQESQLKDLALGNHNKLKVGL